MESYYRTPKEIYDNEICFQALEWQDFNEPDDTDADTAIDVENFDVTEHYVIRVFGVNTRGDSVCLNVKNFTPFFYIKVPENWTKINVKTFIFKLCQKFVIMKNNNWVNCSKYIITDKCILQHKKDFYGFSNEKEYKFLRLVFNNSDAMRRAINIIRYHNKGEKKLSGFSVLPLYETSLDNMIRFAHIKELKFAGWMKVNSFTTVNEDDKKSTCQIEIDSDWKNVHPVDNNSNAPFLQASYDIETYSVDGSFPSPSKQGNVITQIATTFKKFGESDVYMKHLICLKKCSDLDDPTTFLECYDTEQEVLLAWQRLVKNMDPDILYQYNGDWFDGHYLYTRAVKLRCDEDFLVLGKLKNKLSKLDEKSFSSSAYGSTNFRRLTMPGRINFDILTYIKREYKENSYKLDYISEKYLGENKNPVTPQMMFAYFKEGDPDKIKIVGEYCLKDTLLPQRLVDKMHILQNQISMSNVTFVPIRYLTERGQQIKVYSQILKETRKSNYLVPTLESVKDDTTFTGATVLSPIKGAYFEPITVCDFASLYPSIIRAHNLCFSTIVLKDDFDSLQGIDYKTFDWEEEDGTKHKYSFVQNTKGILPTILANLTNSRKEYKLLMAGTEDIFLKEVYNKCQLAVKVSMNSIYGFLAAPMLRCKPIAATVTYIGRTMIDETKLFVEKNYDASVAVYGDSVTGDTPLLLKNTRGDTCIKSIEEIASQWVQYKEFKPFDTNRKNKLQAETEYEVWTDSGWSKIVRVIKHTTCKTIHRVMSHFGVVDVTEDHSLLDVNKKIIKPVDCKFDTELLFSFPDDRVKTEDITEPEAFVLGLFDGTGDMANIDKVLNTSRKAQLSYLKGFSENYTGNILDNGKIIGFITKSKINTAKFYYLLKCLYNTVTLDLDEDIYILYINKTTKVNNVIYNHKIFEEGFITVYDLETKKGRFQAGIGQNIIKNTDSVFIKFKTSSTNDYKAIQGKPEKTEDDKIKLEELKIKCIQESIDLGIVVAEKATETLFKYPIKLEYEKIYCPLLLLSKKRYIGMLYENDTGKCRMDNKGIVLKRRDNFELLKKTYSKVIDIVLTQGSFGTEEAKEYIISVLYKIINNDFKNLDDFIISKTLKDNYKSQNIPHLVLSRKLHERDPGSAPNSNDRVPYVFIDIFSKKKEPQYKKVEDPKYVLEHKLPLDAEYYINFMKTSLCEILSLFIDSPEQIFKDVIEEYKNTRW